MFERLGKPSRRKQTALLSSTYVLAIDVYFVQRGQFLALGTNDRWSLQDQDIEKARNLAREL